MTILKVKNAVLLQNGALHGLDDNTRGGVVDLRRFFMELLGEQVDAQVAVLAGSG